MKFTLVSIAVMALAPVALANLHTSLWCQDITPAQSFKQGPEAKENNDATDAACAAYRNRNTGTQQWDTCPDCVVQVDSRNNFHHCTSAGKHLGGDEFDYYCKKAGATGGAS